MQIDVTLDGRTTTIHSDSDDAKKAIAYYMRSYIFSNWLRNNLGSLVESSIDDLNKIINVNLIGMYKINNLFFPMLNKDGSRIINISSEYGVLDAIPFHTFYPISKHAVEIYNDGLRRELSGQNIKVIAIRPGAFKTAMQGNINNQFEEYE